jgi:hypothetical protein
MQLVAKTSTATVANIFPAGYELNRERNQFRSIADLQLTAIVLVPLRLLV